MEQNKKQDRRSFLKGTTALTALGVMGAGVLLNACENKKVSPKEVSFLDKAPDGKLIRLAIVGCGSRGTGALVNMINYCPNIEIVALADVFQDKLNRCHRELEYKYKIIVPKDKCFIGFDAYKDILALDIDLVLLTAPPFFRPLHFAAAVEAGKNIFMEKPVAVDPVGVRSIIETGKKASEKGLKVAVGTQRRHQRDYVATLEMVKTGLIGDIVAANCYWNQGALWYSDPQPGWNEMEAMIRNWANWRWLSGDHIVEQHIHNIDAISWFVGMLPSKALGMGSRQRRLTGDQYDNFSVSYEYANGVRLHSMCRQMNGCAYNVAEFIKGTKGSTNCQNTIWDEKGNVVWKYDYQKYVPDAPDGSMELKVSAYDQQMIDLVAAIRNNTPYNEAEGAAKSTLVAIMGRESAYTGAEVSFDDMMKSDLKIGPAEIKMANVNYPAIIPVPGSGY